MIRWNRSFLLILAMVFATALGVYLIRAVEEPGQPVPELVPVPVEVAGITPRDFTYRLEALGTVRAIREAAVGAKVSGPVTRIPLEIELGATVEQGTLLAEIDPTSFRIEVDRQKALVARAEADVRSKEVDIARQNTLIRLSREKLRLTRAEHERLINLLEKNLIARQDVERAELSVHQAEEEVERAESGLREAQAQLSAAKADLASAEAELARAREALADTQVRAPFSGVVSEKQITLGEQVGTGTVLFRLADLTSIKLLVRIPADDIDFLRQGRPAEVVASGLPEPFQGRVEHIGPRADEETRTFPAEIVVKNQGPKRLLPGMFARAYIPVHTYPEAILIPRSSVVTEAEKPVAFVADENQGTARSRAITIARTFGSRHLIRGGLQSGDLLVVAGQRLLRDGAAIRIVGRRELEP
jgi:cobalt-zinc-cadmium efflux system membrane fusion protein